MSYIFLLCPINTSRHLGCSTNLLYKSILNSCLEIQYFLSQFTGHCSCLGCATLKRHKGEFNKANLRDLIAATGLVILLKFDPNHRFCSPFDLEIWCMTSKNDRAPLLYYIKLCVSFQIHRWIQTKVTLPKRSIWVKIGDFFPLWPWNLMDDLGKQ